MTKNRRFCEELVVCLYFIEDIIILMTGEILLFGLSIVVQTNRELSNRGAVLAS